MRQATLLFLVEDERILLAMKKRGFGKGHWNGVGGKVDQGETPQQATVRECQEEIKVTPLNLKLAGKLIFNYPKETGVNFICHVFICHTWRGNPKETEEMAPQWFKKSEIPYESMWEDDHLWLPKVLDGKFVTGRFNFDGKQKLIKHELKTT